VRLFNTLALEITSRCNRSCKFCPVAYNERPDERMEWSLVEKALAELGRLKYRGRVEFYIYNEPMRDREYLLRCVRAARELCPRATLMIATNGDYIKGADDILRLLHEGLNQILINCYSPGVYGKRVKWIASLSSLASVSTDDGVYSATGPSSRVVQMLDKSDPEEFGQGVFGLINRAGNIPEFLPPTAAPVERMCVKPFRLLNVNWRGEALLCCNDYHGDVSYGNLGESTLEQLWNHPVLVTYRRHLLRKDRSLPLCRECDCHAGAYPGNVDRPGLREPGATREEVEAVYGEGLFRRGKVVELGLVPAQTKTPGG
jgi:MoaA/NifB/PqqE/SkfB family radical SAM enzyme